jgi:hypothetical protein
VATNVAGRLASLTKRLPAFERAVVTTAGQIVADSVMAQMTSDTHGGTMRNLGKSGARLDIRITPLSSPVGVRIKPSKAGPWVILQKGTSAHLVAARAGRGRSSRGRAMSIGGSWRAGPWRVGGVRGKQTWTTGRDAGFAKALPEVRAMFAEVVADG